MHPIILSDCLAGARIQKNDLSPSLSLSLSFCLSLSSLTVLNSLPYLGSHGTSWTDGGMESFQHLSIITSNTDSLLSVCPTSSAATVAAAGATRCVDHLC